jgi:hypothetical protein
MRRRRALGAALAGLLLAGAAACTGDDAPSPTPRRRTERPPLVDYTGVALEKVPGTTTTSVDGRDVGTASIVGTVSGPSGPVPGATVRVEHLIGKGTVVHDALSGPDGRYAVTGIAGGRYRVRAFLVPTLALTKPEVRFLPDGREEGIDLTMADQRKVVASAATSPDAAYVGDPVNLAVTLATQQVDADGIVRSTPVIGVLVTLDGLGAWSLRGDDDLRPPGQPRFPTTTIPASPDGFTDGTGTVRFALRCLAAGDPGLGVLVTVTVTPAAVAGQPPPTPVQQTQRLDLRVPACIDPTAATTPPNGDDGSGGGDSTSTSEGE